MPPVSGSKFLVHCLIFVIYQFFGHKLLNSLFVNLHSIFKFQVSRLMSLSNYIKFSNRLIFKLFIHTANISPDSERLPSTFDAA